MTIKVQLKREVNGVMQQVNPITSEECVILGDGKKLNEVIDFATTAEDFVDETIVIEENLVDRVESIENRIVSEFEEQNSQITTGLSNIKTIEQNISNKVDTEVAKVNAQLSELANKGTTVEVLESVTKEEIERQIADGTIANLTIADNSITEDKYKDRSVSAKKVKFLIPSENLFNENDSDIEVDKFINVLGNASSAIGYNISGYIEVEINNKYTYKFNAPISGENTTFIYYSAEKVKLGYASGVLSQNQTTCTITIPNDQKIKYVRVTFTSEQKQDFMFVKGESYPTVYKKYGEIKLTDNVVLNDNQKDEIKSTITKCLDETPITPSQTTFFNTSKNLFNKNDSDIEVNKFINVNGGTSSANGYNISGYIEVIEQEKYIYKFNQEQLGNNSTFLYFNENDNQLGFGKGSISSDGLTCVITIPTNAKKIKFSYATSDVDDLMFVKGESYPTIYEKYGDVSLSEIIGLNDNQKNQVKELGATNPLQGKIITANGDSICYGAGFIGGFVKIIAERNNMIYQNIAVNGATVTAGTVDTNTGNNRHWICRTVSNMRDDADYCILEGSVNDIGDNVDFGVITNTMTADLDDTTFCGAFERMLKEAVLRFDGKKIGFILVHRMFNLDHEYHVKYYPAILQMCEKWGVPICNLYATVPSLNLINDLKEVYTKNADGWHPNEDGYKKYYCDKIEQFLISL